MRYSVLSSSLIRESLRSDVKHFVDEGYQAHIRVSKGPWESISVGEFVGLENVWTPPGATLVEAKSEQFGKPYLAPFDTLRYILRPKAIVSRKYYKSFASGEVKRGQLLITCSGRNLGPCVWVDQVLSEFVVSSDMIRVSSDDPDKILYLMAFLHTPTGQQLIRRSRSGSIIDHISPKTVRELRIPLLSNELRRQVVADFRTSTSQRENARQMIREAECRFMEMTSLDIKTRELDPYTFRRRFIVDSASLSNRIDAEPQAPVYSTYRRLIEETGFGCTLSDIAHVSRPPGRFKTYYVPEEYGIPMLSGRQLAQYRPVALKYISPMSFDSPSDYLLAEGTVVVTADGRAEENLADCALICYDRENWAASGHMIRLASRIGINPGLLYLSVTCEPVQAMLKSLATGSVVDALSEDDISTIKVPYPVNTEASQLGDMVVKAWMTFADATVIEDRATRRFESELLSEQVMKCSG